MPSSIDSDGDSFLSSYGFGKARGYFLFHRGKAYDSKAIAGVAHRYLPGHVSLASDAFSGGENGAAGRLRELGFDVRGPNEQPFANVPFEPGGVYNRARDIHEVYGGQQRGGISTPSSAPLIFLFTGETGSQYGYRDGPRDDGMFAYTGEGQVGDMEFVRGNLAIRDHISNGRDLLLFEKLRQSGSYRFVGYFACDGFEYATAPDKNGASRRVIVFHLRAAAAGEDPEIEQAAARLRGKSLEELRRQAIEDAADHPERREGRRSYVERSASVRAYVLKRSGGICEAAINQPLLSARMVSLTSSLITPAALPTVGQTILSGSPPSAPPAIVKSTMGRTGAQGMTNSRGS